MGQVMQKTLADDLVQAPDWSAVRGNLLRLAVALTRSRADAEDLTQQTLAALLARRPDRAAHAGYGRRTMVRTWLDQQRSLRRQFRRLTRLAMGSKPWHLDDDRMSNSDQLERLHTAIESLPPRQHATLVLRLVEELDYERIAATLDCSVQSVRANLHLGRQRVRQLVGEVT
jgi:RNA polymerase sigma-70 factor (ECF subfamily)